MKTVGELINVVGTSIEYNNMDEFTSLSLIFWTICGHLCSHRVSFSTLSDNWCRHTTLHLMDIALHTIFVCILPNLSRFYHQTVVQNQKNAKKGFKSI